MVIVNIPADEDRAVARKIRDWALASGSVPSVNRGQTHVEFAWGGVTLLSIWAKSKLGDGNLWIHNTGRASGLERIKAFSSPQDRLVVLQKIKDISPSIGSLSGLSRAELLTWNPVIPLVRLREEESLARLLAIYDDVVNASRR